MSIVEFAEEILGYKLLDFQKEFLNKCYECYEAYVSNKKIYYIPPRGNGRFSLTMMQLIAMEYYSIEHELNKEVTNGRKDN